MTSLSSDSRPIIGRDPPLGAGLFALAVLSITLMVLDHRSNYLDTARLWLGAAVTPIYAVVQAPHQAWQWLTGSFSDRSQLREENAQLNENCAAPASSCCSSIRCASTSAATTYGRSTGARRPAPAPRCCAPGVRSETGTW